MHKESRVTQFQRRLCGIQNKDRRNDQRDCNPIYQITILQNEKQNYHEREWLREQVLITLSELWAADYASLSFA